MILWAFDCDGTAEISNGPVPVKMMMYCAAKGKAFIIGNPLLCGVVGLPHSGFVIKSGAAGVNYPGSKSQALKDWKAAYPGMEKYIVVDDDPLQYPGGWDGWEFLSPTEFMDRIKEWE